MSRFWRSLLRMVYWQLALGALGGLLVWVVTDVWHGLSFGLGAMLVASGLILSARFGLKLQPEPAAALIQMFVGVLFRWLWWLAGLVLVLGRWQLPAWPMLLGLIGAQALFIGLGATKRE